MLLTMIADEQHSVRAIEAVRRISAGRQREAGAEVRLPRLPALRFGAERFTHQNTELFPIFPHFNERDSLCLILCILSVSLQVRLYLPYLCFHIFAPHIYPGLLLKTIGNPSPFPASSKCLPGHAGFSYILNEAADTREGQ